MATIDLVASVVTNAQGPWTTPSFAVEAGDLLIVAWGTTEGSSSSVSDSAGGTWAWTAVGWTVNFAPSPYAHLYCATRQQVTGTGSMTVTHNTAYGGASNYGSVMMVFRVRGVVLLGTAAIRQVSPAWASSIFALHSAGETPAVTYSAAPLSANPHIFLAACSAYPPGCDPPPGAAEALDDECYTYNTVYGAVGQIGVWAGVQQGGRTSPAVTWGGTIAGAHANAWAIELDTTGGVPYVPIPTIDAIGINSYEIGVLAG